jgi:nucleotide-binding universal stress UspA family protein
VLVESVVMGRHVLVGIDGSDQSTNALEYALDTFPDATISVISVVNPVAATAGDEFFDGSALEQQRELAENHLESASAVARAHDREVDTDVRIGSPARELIASATESDVDHIVVGSHGRTGLSRILLGSVAETVVRRSPVPVTVVR